MICIIDYNVANVGSIKNIVKKVGYDAIITNKEEDILKATKIILPGVGAFDAGMNKLKSYKLIDILNYKKNDSNVKILGICLGMQLMTNFSGEGNEKGLGWIDAQATKFSEMKVKVPHMGWNFIKMNENCYLFKNFESKPRFYFVHSYYVECNQERDIAATAFYEYNFVCAFVKDNIAGVQFHPEKSHKFGMRLIKNFIEQ